MTALVSSATAQAAAERPIPQLSRNSVTLGGALFVAVTTMAPGAGACFAIVSGANFAGGALPTSVIIALVGCLFVAVAVGQLAKHIPSAGGVSTYIAEAIHSGPGFIAAWAYPAVFISALGYLSLIFGDLLATSLVPSGKGTTFQVLWIVGAVGCLALAGGMNWYGIKFGTRIGMILGALEIAVLVILSVWMIVKAGDRNTLSVIGTHYSNVKGFTGTSGIVGGSIYGFLAFVGFEAAAPLGEEATEPKKTIPRAVVCSALVVGVFFFFTTYASDVFYGPSRMGSFLSYGNGDPWIALTKVVWGGGWVVLLITLLNSSLACSNAAGIASTRTWWAMGRIKTMPARFSHTHPRWNSPSFSIAVVFGIGMVLALWLGEQFTPTLAYELMGTVLTIMILPIYFVVALACPVYYFRRRRDELNWFVHVVIPILGMAFLVPAFLTGAGVGVFSFVAPLTYPLSLAGPAVAVWYGLGIGIMLYLKKRHPERLKATAEVFLDDTPAEEEEMMLATRSAV